VALSGDPHAEGLPTDVAELRDELLADDELKDT
jgi:hypothetical protein